MFAIFLIFFRVYDSPSNSFTLKLGIQVYANAVYCWWLESYISRYTLYAYYRYVTCSNKKDFQNVSNQDHIANGAKDGNINEESAVGEWEMIRRTIEEFGNRQILNTSLGDENYVLLLKKSKIRVTNDFSFTNETNAVIY